ncbi:hypothetical protein D3C81_2141390 [compost metagenome]
MYADRRTRPFAADNLHMSAQLFRTLAHRGKTIGALLMLNMFKPLAVIADAEHHLPWRFTQRQTDNPGSGMLNDIRHGLLDNQK